MDTDDPVRKTIKAIGSNRMLRAMADHKNFSWTGALVSCSLMAAVMAVVFFILSGSFESVLAGIVIGTLCGISLYIRLVRDNRGDFDPPEEGS
jgi:hypothetical protein